MDWSASGILNTFEFELLDGGLNHTGWLDGVTGGSVVQAYRGDYRVTGTIECDGEFPPMSGYVRIWHTATLGAETVLTCLATLVADKPRGEYADGRWTGSVDLYSGMKRMDTTLRMKDAGIAKNRNLSEYWEGLVSGPGSVPRIEPGISLTAGATKAYVLEFGETWLSEAHVVADALGGYNEIADTGEVVLAPYIAPANRSASWSLVTDADSVVLPGVGLDPAEVVNRVVARYEDDGKLYYSSAQLDDAHPWSRGSIGRWEMRSVDADAVAAPIQANLDKLAQKELDSAAGVGDRYEVRCLFDPDIRPGTVGTLTYSDGPGSPGITLTAFCSQREVELDAAMTMTLTLEEM